MAINAIEIDATAAELEAAAKAEKWNKEKISNTVYPFGSIVFFADAKTLDQINQYYGTTSAWAFLGTLQLSEGSTVYVYQKIK